MSNTKTSGILKRIAFYIIFLLTAALHFFVTFVVVLFVLSTINIVNRDMLHMEKLDYFEIVVTAVIFLISAFIFFRSLKKISLFIKTTFFRDHLR